MYSEKSSWCYVMCQGKGTPLYMIPNRACPLFFGGKAGEAVLQSNLPREGNTGIRKRPQYAERRGLALDILDDRDWETVYRLLKIKMGK